ncbi:ABC transporter permease [Pedosphaera parvula]|uniref:Inner-membrane translocator n=1 Tax=Pedosphaera parvula (strain Ellin514) TaxID=320771 RepID=B9XRR2_PEDPL|nr:ABC transporter permease [Pedosphaera parvula]EEF57477.1 inner-membrane translocator [Pedosphaera parvula Ellin514]
MKRLLQPILAVALGLALGLAITWFAGENPWHVLKILGHGAFGSGYDFGMTLFYATPLIFTGLSVAIAFHAGLFNIGAEGQLTLGALAAAAVGALWPGIPWPLGPMLAGVTAICAGTLWGAIPGWLRARHGSHEVINTIMLNFVAAGLASYVTLYLLKNPDSQNPETRPIGTGYLIHQFEIFGGAPVSAALPLAILATILVWVLLWRTALGFEIRAVGQNESAARAAGIDTARIRIIALSLAGGLAGMVGIGEVLGNAGKFRMGFSPDYGFLGIAVALLGQNRPAGIVAAALLFGALHKGTADLDLETEHVTRELSLVLQALIILSVSAEGLWSWMKKRGQT